ncbi:MAG TPA: 50S ribosomal protein L32 [Candidatus Sumerlaeota bacterium]|nr:50S ribosomal protein L32 [Candidatus Sumerlaeota bacterium]HPS01596.1 50S ribosomal protein L32 [Candidatus Sumerlaeota bacterium]
MPVPRRRHGTSRRKRSRNHKKLTASLGASCPRCNAVKAPHRICPSCGYYKDRAFTVTVTAE